MKLWAGRFSKDTDDSANDFNSSLSFDIRLYKHDIKGSIAHAMMLGKIGVLNDDEVKKLVTGLEEISSDLSDGTIELNPEAEDIHMAVEELLTLRIGDTGRKLHTARSRNDQIALDTRMYLRDECRNIMDLLIDLCKLILDTASSHTKTIMPGFTHMQPAQPITLAHHIMAYFEMFSRDLERLSDTRKRINVMPLGSCALAGTGFPIDREYVAGLLGFEGITLNSIDAVSDRDFVIELLSDISLISMHLSRFCEEIILWNTNQFSFAEQDDSFSTGSSIMPQKKNPDIAELIRGKTGRVYGNLFTVLTVMKGLPLAYNKDMQEDKPALFDSIDTISACLSLFTKMFANMSFKVDNMADAAGSGFTNATDLADYLVSKGIAFRTAHEITGRIVSYCISRSKGLQDLTTEEFHSFSDVIGEDILEFISLESCVNRRTTAGGPSEISVNDSISRGRKLLSQFN